LEVFLEKAMIIYFEIEGKENTGTAHMNNFFDMKIKAVLRKPRGF